METYLKASYSKRKSFNKKADIDFKNGKIILYSYNTKVAIIKNNKAKVFGTYSPTTLRHIKEFLLQNGFKADTKKQIKNDYIK